MYFQNAEYTCYFGWLSVALRCFANLQMLKRTIPVLLRNAVMSQISQRIFVHTKPFFQVDHHGALCAT